MQKKRMVILGAALAFTMALLLTLYPLISNYINQKYASEIHTSYQEAVEQAEDGELEQARKLAQDYNASIVPGAADSNAYSQEALLAASADYESQLNILGDGTMGYIQIPKIDVLLPILHGTEADVLERGIGHLLGSSLPVGGESTHTVLTGHSGMASNTMFTDLELLEEGDVFYLQILNEVLAYRVLDTNVVLPHESDLLSIVREEDLCTLVTCVPYGVNTHRLLVLGERIPYEMAEQIQEAAAQEQEEGSTWKQKYLSGLLIGLCMALGGMVLVTSVYQIWKKYHRNFGGGRYVS